MKDSEVKQNKSWRCTNTEQIKHVDVSTEWICPNKDDSNIQSRHTAAEKNKKNKTNGNELSELRVPDEVKDSACVQTFFSKEQNAILITLLWENFHLYDQVKAIQWFTESFIILDNEKHLSESEK